MSTLLTYIKNQQLAQHWAFKRKFVYHLPSPNDSYLQELSVFGLCYCWFSWIFYIWHLTAACFGQDQLWVMEVTTSLFKVGGKSCCFLDCGQKEINGVIVLNYTCYKSIKCWKFSTRQDVCGESDGWRQGQRAELCNPTFACQSSFDCSCSRMIGKPGDLLTDPIADLAVDYNLLADHRCIET